MNRPNPKEYHQHFDGEVWCGVSDYAEALEEYANHLESRITTLEPAYQWAMDQGYGLV